MNPMMQQMQQMTGLGGSDGAGPLLEDEDIDEAPLSSSGASSAGGVASVPASSGIAVVPAAVPDVPAEDDDPSQVHQRLADALITRSATYLKNIGRNRLSDCLERMHKQLDATYTAERSRNGLLVLIWVFTRVKPNVKISDLRVLAVHESDS